MAFNKQLNLLLNSNDCKQERLNGIKQHDFYYTNNNNVNQGFPDFPRDLIHVEKTGIPEVFNTLKIPVIFPEFPKSTILCLYHIKDGATAMFTQIQTGNDQKTIIYRIVLATYDDVKFSLI